MLVEVNRFEELNEAMTMTVSDLLPKPEPVVEEVVEPEVVEVVEPEVVEEPVEEVVEEPVEEVVEECG